MANSALRRLDLNLLLVLHTVLQTRNVTEAGRRLNMSQPAVSRAVGRLRVVFDDPLFTKGASGVVATPRAEALSGAIATLLADLEATIGTPAFDPGTATRIFRIATTDYGALAVIPALTVELAVSSPGAGIEIIPFGLDTFRSLAAGEIDLVLYTDDPVPDGLASAPLFDETYTSLVRADHPMIERGIDLDMFLAYPHILVTVFGGRTGVLDVALATVNRSRRIGLSIPYFATAALIAAQSDLILTLPGRVVRQLAGPHKLVAFDPPVRVEGYGYRMIWHPRTDKDPASFWLREQATNTVERDAFRFS